MKKKLLFTLSLSVFSAVAAFSVMAQINPEHERFEKVFQPSFTRLTPQGPATPSGTSILPTSPDKKTSGKNRSSKGYTNLQKFANEVNSSSFNEASSLQKSQLLHSSLYDINALKRQLTYLDTNILNARVQERRLSDFETCAKKRLEKNFEKKSATDKDGKVVSSLDLIWESIKDIALKKYKGEMEKVALEDDIALFEEKFYTGASSEDIEGEKSENADSTEDIQRSKDVLSNWVLARDVLINLYENQDDYGTRVCQNGRCPSFPAWEDQKYVYNETVWKPKYDEIRKKMETVCPKKYWIAEKEPKVKDEQKYDYYYYDEVKTAHKAFINRIHPECRALLEGVKMVSGNELLLDPPAQMDRPLPPVEEVVALITDSNGKLREIYPEIPKPWKKMVGANGCKLFNNGKDENGVVKSELAQRFNCDPSTGKFSLKKEIAESGQAAGNGNLKEQNAQANKLISGSLVSQFYALHSEKVNADSMLMEYIDLVEKTKTTLEEYAKNHDVKLDKELDFYTKEGLDKVFKTFNDAQNKELEKVAKAIGTKAQKKNPTIKELKDDPEFAMYYALSYDKTGDLDVTEESAPYVQTFVDALTDFRARFGQAGGEGLVLALQTMKEEAGTDDYKKMAGLIVLQEITSGDVEDIYKEKLLEKTGVMLDAMCQNGGIYVVPVFDPSNAANLKWLKNKINEIIAAKKIAEEETQSMIEAAQTLVSEAQEDTGAF